MSNPHKLHLILFQPHTQLPHIIHPPLQLLILHRIMIELHPHIRQLTLTLITRRYLLINHKVQPLNLISQKSNSLLIISNSYLHLLHLIYFDLLLLLPLNKQIELLSHVLFLSFNVLDDFVFEFDDSVKSVYLLADCCEFVLVLE